MPRIWFGSHLLIFKGFFYEVRMTYKEKFPLWKPHFRTEEKFWGDSKRSFLALRRSSESFTKSQKVRNAIMEKSNFKCTYCGSKKNLQIDHIISVYQAFKDKTFISILNSYQNLQVLCLSCNASKDPSGQNNE